MTKAVRGERGERARTDELGEIKAEQASRVQLKQEQRDEPNRKWSFARNKSHWQSASPDTIRHSGRDNWT